MNRLYAKPVNSLWNLVFLTVLRMLLSVTRRRSLLGTETAGPGVTSRRGRGRMWMLLIQIQDSGASGSTILPLCKCLPDSCTVPTLAARSAQCPYWNVLQEEEKMLGSGLIWVSGHGHNIRSKNNSRTQPVSSSVNKWSRLSYLWSPFWTLYAHSLI